MDVQSILRRLDALEATVRELRPIAAAPPPPRLALEVLPPAPAPVAPPEPAAVDGWGAFERHVGKRWITWGGSLALFVAAALFVKLYVGSGGGSWFTAPWRVASAATFGVVLLGLGHRALRSLRVLGQGLLGTGLAVLYLSVFAGLAYYHLYSREVALVALVATTVLGAAIALRHDAQAIAMLALLGGLATPPLVSTGTDGRDALFAYLLILDLGVLGISVRKGWRALDVVATAGTWLLFAGWFEAYFEPFAAAPTMLWLALFFTALVALPFAHHLRRGVPIDDARFVLAIVNALVMVAASRAVLGNAAATSWVALAMAAAYTALGALTRRRLPDDGRAIFGFITLATALVTLALALRLEHRGLVLSWAIEGPVLCWLGYRYRYFPVRAAGLVVVALAALKLATVATPWLAQMCVPLAGGLYALVHHRHRGDGRDAPLRTGAAIGSALLALSLTHLELARVDASPWAIIAMWFAAALWLFRAGAWRTAVLAATWAAVVALWSYAIDDRFTVGLAAVAIGVTMSRLTRSRTGAALTLFTLWGLCSFEAPGPTAVTVVWGAFAIGLIAAGLWASARPLRLAGLALFAITAAKLVLVDLSTVHQAYRVVSFLVIGVAMIAASYLYHRLERKLGA